MRRARIIVSLADNANQGIVPIKPSLGNGQNPNQNLYWGALYGMKTHFRRIDNWTLATEKFENPNILDSFSMAHSNHNDALISVEAWNGANQVDAVKSYFKDLRDSRSVNDLVCFVGHNALMDVFLADVPAMKDAKDDNQSRRRKGAVIACNSSQYFASFHQGLGVESYVMTNGLMAPEAYVMEGVLMAWLENQSSNSARLSAAEKYAEYQRISVSSASRLFGVKK